MLLDRVPFNRGVAPPFPTLPLPFAGIAVRVKVFRLR